MLPSEPARRDFMIFLYSIFYIIKIERMQNFNSIIDLLTSDILIFKLILICRFQNVPCALGFDVKHSKNFLYSFQDITAVVPSSRLGPSMWVSWWKKRGLGRFFSGFLPFSPITNFIPPFLHSHFIHFVSFYQPL